MIIEGNEFDATQLEGYISQNYSFEDYGRDPRHPKRPPVSPPATPTGHSLKDYIAQEPSIHAPRTEPPLPGRS